MFVGDGLWWGWARVGSLWLPGGSGAPACWGVLGGRGLASWGSPGLGSFDEGVGIAVPGVEDWVSLLTRLSLGPGALGPLGPQGFDLSH